MKFASYRFLRALIFGISFLALFCAEESRACLNPPLKTQFMTRLKLIVEEVRANPQNQAQLCTEGAPLRENFDQLLEESDIEYPEFRNIHNDIKWEYAGFQFYCKNPEEALRLASEVVVDDFKSNGSGAYRLPRFYVGFWDVFISGVQPLQNAPNPVEVVDLAIKFQKNELSESQERLLRKATLGFLNQVKNYCLERNDFSVFNAVLIAYVKIDVRFGETLLRDLRSESVIKELSAYKFLDIHHHLFGEVLDLDLNTSGAVQVEMKDGQMGRWRLVANRLEELLKRSDAQYSDAYRLLAGAYLYLGRLEEAEKLILETLERFEDASYLGRRNLCIVYSELKNYPKALEGLDFLLSKSDLKPELEDEVRYSRSLILHAQGDTEALAPVLKKKRQKALNQRKKIIQAILQERILKEKETQAKIQEKNLLLERQQKYKEQAKLLKKTNKSQADSTFVLELETEKPIKPRRIKKSKAVVSKSKPAIVSAVSPSSRIVDSTKLKTIEELLLGKKRALTIFEKFFENYSTKTRVQAIDISMEEVEILMDALEQDFDPSSGKGSHTKISLNSSLQPEVEAAPEDTMVILSRRAKLSGAQIDDLREKFLKYYLFPKDLKDTLVKLGKLPQFD